MTIWSIVSTFVWRQLFAEWVYPTDSELSGKAFRYGDELFQVKLHLGFCMPRYLSVLIVPPLKRRSQTRAIPP